ncbi:hypothetical protein [Aliikangiella sp. IMCC44632]
MMTKNYIAVVLFCISFLCKSADYKCVDRDFSAEQSEKTIMVRLIETNGKLDIFLPKQKDISAIRHLLFDPMSSFSVEGEMYSAVFFRDKETQIEEDIAFKEFGVNSTKKILEHSKKYGCGKLDLFFRNNFGSGAENRDAKNTYFFNNMFIEYSEKYKYFRLLIPYGKDLYSVHLVMSSSAAFKEMYDFFAIEP